MLAASGAGDVGAPAGAVPGGPWSLVADGRVCKCVVLVHPPPTYPGLDPATVPKLVPMNQPLILAALVLESKRTV